MTYTPEIRERALAILQRTYQMAKDAVAQGDANPALKRQMAAARKRLAKETAPKGVPR